MQQPVKAMVLVREAERGGTAEHVDPDEVGIARDGKCIFNRADIQRGRIELVGELGIFLVVRLTVYLDFAEKFERRANPGSHQAKLEQNEEEQWYDDDRNERKYDFLQVRHGDLSGIRAKLAILNIP
ncbi:MAG: hypothetical protein R3358_00285 [Woeseiaceae bacterium]|nr:hypothetical protein [Woeseiaceae bacterium]